MAQIEIVLPAMGEGIIEAEITRWLVREGDGVEIDSPVVEVATDKVDSEIPSPVTGIMQKILLAEGDVPKVGQVIALVSTGDIKDDSLPADQDEVEPERKARDSPDKQQESGNEQREIEKKAAFSQVYEERNISFIAFLSPVIRKMAREQNISPEELKNVKGSGKGERITRADLQSYLSEKEDPDKDIQGGKEPVVNKQAVVSDPSEIPAKEDVPGKPTGLSRTIISPNQLYGQGATRVEEMDRMRRLIADHMVYSKKVAPHVTSFVEADVTGMIIWREKFKDEFLNKYNQKLTITTLILEAVARCLKDTPGINVSLDGYQIIRKSSVNIGMATALPDGNLIVPVIHDADRLNLPGMATAVNDLANRARLNKLQPAEIQGGTFTVTNLGNFGNIAGTPVINQPEVAILAVGAIQKKPAVVVTPQGDAIGIRHIMILSMAYDHRIVDGTLGGSFLSSIGKNLQNFDVERSI